jgi:MEMO1 family protein
MHLRPPVAAGRFYPGSADAIRQLLNEVRGKSGHPVSPMKPAARKLIGGVVPHAGYRYCAREALAFFDLLGDRSLRPQTVVILHPDHFGRGDDISVDGHDGWQTPLGLVETDCELREMLGLPLSTESEQDEHAAEVLLPYLQFSAADRFRLLAISMREQSCDNARLIADRIREAATAVGRRILVLASSDFSHYVRPEVGFNNDNLVLDRILQFNAPAVFDVVTGNRISVCGYGPIMALIGYALQVSPLPEAVVLARGNSGKCGDPGEVVDYVSIAVYA